MSAVPDTTFRFKVPDDLREHDQWVMWRYVCGTKEPFQITGRHASSTNPETWTDFDSALAAWQRRPDQYAGIGFVFCEADPYVGIDLDDCLDEHGATKAWA